MAKRIKRIAEPANLEDFVGSAGEKIKRGVDSLLSPTLQPELPKSSENVGYVPDGLSGELHIVNLETLGADGPMTAFRFRVDALVLRIRVRVGGSLANSREHFDVNFQLVAHETNMVARDFWRRDLTLGDGEFFISQGNITRSRWADKTPPFAWGLGPGIYIFRALIVIPALNLLCVAERSALFQVQ